MEIMGVQLHPQTVNDFRQILEENLYFPSSLEILGKRCSVGLLTKLFKEISLSGESHLFSSPFLHYGAWNMNVMTGATMVISWPWGNPEDGSHTKDGGAERE